MKVFKISLFAFFLSISLFLCRRKDKQEDLRIIRDTASHTIQNVKKAYKLNLKSNSYSYIGFIENFHLTNELYIELKFQKENIKYEEFQSLTSDGDSIIYKDDENIRTRIPADIALKNFDLTGLEPLYLFDKDHQLVSKAHITRIEHLDQNISAGFIAVFNIEKPVKGTEKYVIGSPNPNLKLQGYQTINDSGLTNSILKKYNIRNVESKHFSNSEVNDTITFIKSSSQSWIIRKENDELKILYQSTEHESVSDLLILTDTIHKKPILLMRCFEPEGDMEWSKLLIYDGKSCRNLEKQRLKYQ